MIVELVIPGEPAVKERPRCTGRGAVSTKKQKQAEAEIGRLLQAKYIVPTLHAGPVSLYMRFYTGNAGKDWDNMAKLVCDALNGVLWKDDRQVIFAQVKVRPAHGKPGTIIEAHLKGETEVIAR
jgi:Holliday junction resolvase RusA-like endonuclease